MSHMMGDIKIIEGIEEPDDIDELPLEADHNSDFQSRSEG